MQHTSFPAAQLGSLLALPSLQFKAQSATGVRSRGEAVSCHNAFHTLHSDLKDTFIMTIVKMRSTF